METQRILYRRNSYKKMKARVKTFHLAVRLPHFHFFGSDFAILKHFLGRTSKKTPCMMYVVALENIALQILLLGLGPPILLY